MRNIVAQFQSKTTNDVEGIEVSLGVRLWKISGFHDLMSSLGFDLMDVDEDQVTLRTGKHANKRNCQFVLQALLALFTQEAPKTIGIDSSSNTSSSTESLNDAIENEKASTSTAYNNFPRPLAAPRKMTTSSRSAFISYQKRRGEPDGGHEEVTPAQQPPKTQPTFENTDSELSDGYATQKMLAKYSDLGYGGIRGNPKICRPGGGRESDATFTPSPIENNVSMALAHQTKIRNLYTNISEATSTSVTISKTGSRRPDSSSSASSAAEQNWDSGHATVLRRQNNGNATTLPMPATRQLLPIVDNLRPTAPVYNNLMMQCGIKKSLIMESTSSDSEGWVPSQTRTKIKLHQQFIQQAHQQHHQNASHYQDMPSVSVAKLKEQFNFIDRLSVRTEATKITTTHGKKSIMKTSDDGLNLGNSLYFSPAELQNTTTNLVEDDAGPGSVIQHTPGHSHHKSSKESKVVGSGSSSNINTASSSKKNIQDSILRHMSREMAPTISDVYHERNIGLISAPPLSKLLMTNYEENETTQITQVQPTTSSSPTSGLNKLMNAIDLGEEITNCTSSTAKLLSCGGASNSDEDYSVSVEDEAASSQTTMKSVSNKKSFSSVPWLSSINAENIVKPSDLTTAEILEHQKIKSTSSSSSNSDHLSIIKSPYTEFRDDADGNSQCSSTPKNSLPSKQKGKGNIY